MKKMLMLLMLGVTSFGFADSLDDAARLLKDGKITEEAVKQSFTVNDYKEILERSRRLSLEKAKTESETKQINLLLKARNKELQQELLKKNSKNVRPSVVEMANRVYKGVYGDNPERYLKLREMGFSSQEIKKIQDMVNQIVDKEKNKE